MPKVTYSPGDVLGADDVNDFCQEGFVVNTSLEPTAGEPGGAWAAYTPTCTNISNTTNTGAYMLLGKTVFFRAKVLLTGSSTVSGTPDISLPLASVAATPSGSFNVRLADSDPIRWYAGQAVEINADQLTIYALRDNSSSLSYSYGVAVTSTIPMTWATGDYIEVTGFYETA